MSDVTNERTNIPVQDTKSQALGELVSQADLTDDADDDTVRSIREVVTSLVTAEDADNDVLVSFRGSEPFEVVDVDFDEDGRAILKVR